MNNTLCILLMLLLLFIVKVSAYSQMALDPYAMAQTGVSVITGLTMIEDDEGDITPFYRFQLRPELKLGKVGMGLDAVLLYNPDKDIRNEDGEDWDSLGDYLRVIRYFRYGRQREPLYFVYGELRNMYVGHGLVMGGYSNYDRRGLHLDVNVNTDLFGVEAILNNLAEPDLFGGRIYIRPFQSSESSLIKRLTFGATYMTDIDPNPGNDVDPLTAFSLDVSIPIFNPLGLEIYDELAFLTGHTDNIEAGAGNAIGAGLEIFNTHFKLEYRTFINKYFQPTIFDYTYEFSKPVIIDAEGRESKHGIYSLLTYYLPEKIAIAATYEDYDGPSPFGDPKIYGELIETGLIDRMSLQASYLKRGIKNFDDIFDLDEKSELIVRVGFEVYPPLEFIVTHEFHFREREDEEGFETIRETSFGLSVNVTF